MKIEKTSENFKVIDERCPDDIIFSEMPSVSYTWQSDDITKGEKPMFMPYVPHKDQFVREGEKWRMANLQGAFSVSERDGDVVFSLAVSEPEIGSWGLNLPFNFMGKKNGRGRYNQFLFNSPYVSEDKRIQYCYLTKPNKNNLLVLFESHADGWKMDYSSYSYGHYFVNLQCLKKFDRAYKHKSSAPCGELKISLIPVRDFSEALDAVAKRLGVPVLAYEESGARIGEKVRLIVHGDCDALEADGERMPFVPEFALKREGLIHLVPYYQGKRGADAVLFGYKDEKTLWKASMEAVSETDLEKTDQNLCEHQCWIPAMLRFMLRYGKNTAFESKLKKSLDVITSEQKENFRPRLTVARQENNLFRVWDSERIQEGFFGVTLLWDAYRFFADEKYKQYAVGLLDYLLKNYQKADGRLERISPATGEREDYSSVCCLLIPIADMALEVAKTDPERADKYREAAHSLTKYLYERGMAFSTENEVSEQAEGETEEGSISCTALSLLYYCAKIERKEEYIRRAKDILDFHENWVMRTPIAPQFHSTVRWWETIWEGDKDGPALCCGHGWTIWRAEADYWYGVLTGDETYLHRARNGFLSNMSKINARGQSYACWQADFITGGGETTSSEQVKYRVAYGFPMQTDSGLSRYLWVRFAEILNTGAKYLFN